MQCINCGRGADWVFTTSGVADQPYCDRHLPRAYRGKVAPAPAEEPVIEAPVEAPVEEPVEEPVVEEKPRRTRRRKADEGE